MDTGKESAAADIPKTGRIGRFARIVEKGLDEATYLEVMKNSGEYGAFKPAEKSAWWKQAVETMEKAIGTDDSIRIMEQCGAKCCGKGLRKTAVRLMSEAQSVKDFLQILNTYEVKEGELEYTLEDSNTIIAQHNRCFCKQVARTKETFPNLIYCHCSREFNRQFFSAAFGKEVDVTILQSIIAGAESCKFVIHIPE